MTTKHLLDDELEADRVGSVEDGTPDDLLISGASFEPRSGAALEALTEEYSATSGLVYVNQELLDERGSEKTQQNFRQIRDKLEKHCEQTYTSKGSWLDPAKQLQAIREKLADADISKDHPTITIDITTFNRETLLILLNLLNNWMEHPTIRTLYVSPIEHGEWLTRGHRSIRNILGLTGLHHADRPTSLILMSGFEKDRSLKIIEEFEPSEVLLGIGDPAVKEQFLDRNIDEQSLILDRQDTCRFEFPVNDIDGAYETIRNLVEEKVSDYNVVIAPLNTKLSTIGAWKAAKEYPEVQVTYSIPGEYNITNYSQGAKELYVDYV